MRSGQAVQAGPFAPRAVFRPRQRRDQFGFGAKSIFVVPIEQRSNIGQQRDVLTIRTKGHSGGARGFVISESKIVGDCDQAAPIVRGSTAEAGGHLRITIEIATFAHDDADRETVLRNFVSGQYSNALRVVAFNTTEGWSRDVSEDISGELIERAFDGDDNLPEDTKRLSSARESG